ncbi:MAG TPA: hypothetical protein VHN80_16695 [Kineosporiaceae bacterium]|nr:hypothetical protein [Kineosporiaceae bacterium]
MFLRFDDQSHPGWATTRQLAVGVAGVLPALLVRSGIHHALAGPTSMTDAVGGGRQAPDTGVYLICCALVAFGIAAGLWRWAPRAWQRITTATGRRVLGFGCASLAAAAIGLPFPGVVTHAAGTLISLAAAVGAFRLWNVWRTRWCGAGENPNLLAGVVRPPVRPGQLWWSTGPAQDDGSSGKRAVLVIGRHPGGSWDVAAITFQDKESRLPGQLQVPPQRVRHFTSTGWLNVTDRLPMGRDQLGNYIGRAPHTFHQEVRAHAGIPTAPSARSRGRDRDRVAQPGEPCTHGNERADESTPWWTQLQPESPSGPSGAAGRASDTDGPTCETVLLPWSLPGGDAVEAVEAVPPGPR